MGLLSRIALRNPGPISRMAGRAGSKLSRYSDNVAGQRIDFDYVLQDIASDEARAVGLKGKPLATGVNWGWADSKYPGEVRSDLSPREIREVFDGTADKIAREIEARPPQLYTFSGISGGHNRRYARDLEARLAGSGYEAIRVGEQFFLKPTTSAYAQYMARTLGPAAGAAGAYGMANANR